MYIGFRNSVQYRPVDSLQLSAGIVEDLWVESGNHTWGYRNLEGPPPNMVYGAWQRWNEWCVVIAKVCSGRSMHTGEGAFRRERNAGKIRPCTYVGTWLPKVLVTELYGQDGSCFGSQPNHREGFDCHPILYSDWNAGVSTLKAWGVIGDGAYEPLLVEGWGASTQ